MLSKTREQLSVAYGFGCRQHRSMFNSRGIVAVMAALFFCLPAKGFDYERHRLINRLALGTLPKVFPPFVRAKANAERIQFLGGEPDRWRNNRDRALRHLNGLDHYFDVEDLVPYQLTAAKLSHFRYQFVEQMAVARSQFKLPLPSENADNIKGHPGFLPWSINEHYLKLVSAFSYLKVFEDMGTAEEIANARANVVYRMGILSHFVGDAAQPLHTTKHFNGWVGDNPKGYTTSRRFHSKIDGGFFRATTAPNATALQLRLRPAALLKRPAARAGASGQFQAALNFILAQHRLVEPLYQLEKEKKLSVETPAAGRAFMEGQLLKGSQMLGDLWFTAWKEAPPDRYLQSYLAKRKLEKK
jgi:hypothetical protein